MASPTDLGFDLIPPDPALMNADLQLEAALAPVVQLGEPEPEPLGKGWSFDFVAGRFVRNGSAPAEVFGLDNLRMWIEKTLRTARFAHPIYSAAYGMVEPTQMIGEPLTGELIAAYEDAVVAALAVHDRIASVDGFTYQQDPMDDALYVSFTVTLDDAAEQTIQVNDFPLSQVGQ